MKSSAVKGFVAGVDVGGSHITASLAETSSGKLIANSKTAMPVNSSGSKESILSQWSAVILKAAGFAQKTPLDGIGLAMPGPFDYERGIALMKDLGKYDNIYGVNIRAELKARLGLPKTPILFRNDAQCFLLGECWRGAAVGCSDAIGVTLGTGFGSAFLRNGLCVEDDPGMPPQKWFYNIPFRGVIADDCFSTRGILRAYRRRSGREAADVRALVRLAPDDPHAIAVFHEFGAMLAEFLAPFVRKFAPQTLVIGGNIAKAWGLFAAPLLDGIRKACPEVAVAQACLFEDAALLGAARLPLLYREPAS
ncbi:MAG: ROK family protein [bacterium]